MSHREKDSPLHCSEGWMQYRLELLHSRQIFHGDILIEVQWMRRGGRVLDVGLDFSPLSAARRRILTQ